MSQIPNLHGATGSSSDDRFSGVGYGTGLNASEARTSNIRASENSDTGAAVGAVKFQPVTTRMRGGNLLDKSLIERASEALEDIENASSEDMSQRIESLRYVACELWRSAAGASIQHQSILANVESVLLSAENITQAQAAGLRGAFTDLAQSRLSEQHVEVVRSRLIDDGHNPLSPLSAIEGQPDAESE